MTNPKHTSSDLVEWCSQDLPCARYQALEAENERLREVLRKILEGEYPRPLGKPWRMDMAPSKHDRCIHDEWMYETCEGCLDAFVSAALEASDGAD